MKSNGLEMTDEEFQQALAQAYSYESRANYGVDHLACVQVGETIRDNQKKVLYRDTQDNYWYKTLVFSGSGKWIDVKQSLFGRYRSKRIYD